MLESMRHFKAGIFQALDLARSTMCDWVAAVANLLLPIYQAMLRDPLLSQVVQTDETRVPVQDPGSRKTKLGRLWVYIGDRIHPHIIYDYTPTKARDGPAKILKEYRGYLQADAANVFDGFYRPGGIVEVGCWAHARRYFHEARDTDPTRSAEALARIGAFYRTEDEAGERAMNSFLAGYYSKDVMLLEEIHRHHYSAASFLLVGSFLNFVYIYPLIRATLRRATSATPPPLHCTSP